MPDVVDGVFQPNLPRQRLAGGGGRDPHINGYQQHRRKIGCRFELQNAVAVRHRESAGDRSRGVVAMPLDLGGELQHLLVLQLQAQQGVGQNDPSHASRGRGTQASLQRYAIEAVAGMGGYR